MGPGLSGHGRSWSWFVYGVARCLDQQYTSNPGDYAYQILEQEIAPGFPFFPGVGNHEFDDPNTMNWIRNFDHGGPAYSVNPGPAGSENTTYSLDHGNVHFVMLNECFDGSDDIGSLEGNWNASLDAWLRNDLMAHDSAITFVFGHFSAFPQPDRDTGLEMHIDDTDFNMFDNGAYRDALWEILVSHEVTAYVCGHTHVSNAMEIDGVWQVDMGHARGPREQNYHGPSTFLRFLVGGDNSVTLETWRQPWTSGEGNEAPYSLWHTDVIKVGQTTPVPETPLATRFISARPNPFNPQTEIAWQQAHSGPVALNVYDLAGKKIATLIDSIEQAGEHSVVWEGIDEQGKKQAAGVYFIELRTPEAEKVLKLVLVP